MAQTQSTELQCLQLSGLGLYVLFISKFAALKQMLANVNRDTCIM